MDKKRGPWIVKSTSLKYKNPWIEVTEDEVVRPDGKPGIFGVIKMKKGISVLPIDNEGFVYLTDEFHYAIGEDGIEVVSGAIDESEEALTAAKRELKEELGIEAVEWIDLGEVNPFTTVINSPAKLFIAKNLQFKESNQEGTESIKMLKVSFEEAVQMVMDNRITHGGSCVLILKANKHLNQK